MSDILTDPNGIDSGRVQPSLIPFLVEGLDITRCVVSRALGVYTALSTATFNAGWVVTRNSSGFIVPCTGTAPIGLAKWNQSYNQYGTVQMEAQVLTGVVANTLAHPMVQNVLVTDITATIVYTGGGVDYTVNATNGTIVRSGGSTIPSGATVLVSYQYLAQPVDYQFNGRNFFNFVSDTAQTQGRITVIQGPATIFSASYDTSQQYPVNASLYCNAGSLVTTVSAGPVIGIVAQAPTASDPYLGFDLTLIG